MASAFHVLRISLAGSKPSIWRRFAVKSSLFLSDLHSVLQDVMGWENCHLYQFDIGGKEYSDQSTASEAGILCADKYRLSQLVKTKGTLFTYTYDFGDDWVHRIKVWETGYKPAEPIIGNFKILAGSGACPPEDVGGIYGYYEFLKAYHDPSHPEHEEMREWADFWDPDNFSSILNGQSSGGDEDE